MSARSKKTTGCIRSTPPAVRNVVFSMIQTDGYVVVGILKNESRYPCLICRHIPDVVWQDLFIPEPTDVPPSFALPESKTLVMPYRLCPQCHDAKPDDWKIRLLMLERLSAIATRCAR